MEHPFFSKPRTNDSGFLTPTTTDRCRRSNDGKNETPHQEIAFLAIQGTTDQLVRLLTSSPELSTLSGPQDQILTELPFGSYS